MLSSAHSQLRTPVLTGLPLLLALTGCGMGSTGIAGSADHPAGVNGALYGGQQPVSGAKLYLYAVSTAAKAGTATSLLDGPGYVVTGAGGNFTIAGHYACPTGAYVYLLALGGNPGLAQGTNNQDIALAAGLGSCSSLTPSSFFIVNEATTVAFAQALGSFATSETQVGSATASDMTTAFSNMAAAVNPASGMANPGPFASTDPGDVRRVKINSLANSLAACVNTDGTGSACSSLMADANVTGTGKPVDTVQAAINIASNTASNVALLYALAPANGPFQPTLSAAPCDWFITTSFTQPSFFANACFVDNTTGSPDFYLAFPDGRFFGYYTFLTGTQSSGYPYFYHYDMGYEYIIQDGAGGALTLYDLASNHSWITSSDPNATYPFPTMFDSTLNEAIRYVVDTTTTGHYTTNPRYFYVPSTGQTISF